MAAILRDSTVVVAVVRTRPRAIPLSMINHEKIHTWVSFSYMVMGLRLAALRAAGAPLSFNLRVTEERLKRRLLLTVFFYRELFEKNPYG